MYGAVAVRGGFAGVRSAVAIIAPLQQTGNTLGNFARTTRVAHCDYFAGLENIPMRERGSFQGAHLHHVIATARDMFPALIGNRPKKVGSAAMGTSTCSTTLRPGYARSE